MSQDEPPPSDTRCSAPTPAGPLLARRALRLLHFRLFAALAQTERMSAAADLLAISQPAASRLAAEVEGILDAKLYERSGRGVALTVAGRAFANRSRRLLLELEATERELDEIATGRSGLVRIGSVDGPAADVILPAVLEARSAMPNVQIDVEVATSDVLGQALYDGHLDFALARMPSILDPGLFVARGATFEPIGLLARHGHPLFEAPRRAAEDLARFDWVFPSQPTLLKWVVESGLLAAGSPPPRQMLSTNSLALTLMVISSSDAIAPMASSVARFFCRFRPTLKGAPAFALLDSTVSLDLRPYALLTIAGRELTPAGRAVCDLVAARLQSRPDADAL